MSKVAIVFWSGTGNTEKMKDAVMQGASSAGAAVTVFGASEFSSDKVAQFDAIAFGCPAMGAEVLEESEFEPMFSSVELFLKDKRVGLFGSWGWGNGAWMLDWEQRVKDDGAKLVTEGVICMNEPDDDALNQCKELGSLLAK